MLLLTRRNFSYVGALAAAAAVSGCVTSAGVQSSSPSEVAKTVEMLRTAMIAGDEPALMKLCADELSFGHSNGVVQTKSEFIGSIVTRQEIFKSIRLTEHHNSVNDNTAIARHIFAADIILKGRDISVELGELQVWEKKGSWQLLARQAFQA